MATARIAATMPTFAVQGPPPRFRITFDGGVGDVNVEIAKAPNYLVAPVSDASDPWTQFSSLMGHSSQGIPAQTLSLNSEGWVDYTLPETAWAGLRTNASHLFYRVRIKDSQSRVWLSHTDAECQAAFCGVLGCLNVQQSSGEHTPAQDILDAMPIWDRMFMNILTWIPEEATRLGRVIDSALYAGFSTEDKARLLALFVRCGYNGRGIFDQLMNLRVIIGSNRTAPALTYEDERGEGRLLDHLLALSEVPLHADINLPASEILYDVMFELVDPGGQSNQGVAGTCTATSIQVYSSSRNPAEVCRWALRLMDRRHLKVKLKNGDDMPVSAHAFRRATWLELPLAEQTPATISVYTRTFSERAIQAALMDYANLGARYNPERDSWDSFHGHLGAALSSGLSSGQVLRLVRALFGGTWVEDNGGGTSLMSYLRGGWPCLLILSWGGSYPVQGYHMVLALRVETVAGIERVVFKNPQYRGAYPPGGFTTGATLTQPPRRIHEVAKCEESMDLAGLQGWLSTYIHEN